jgi:organic hydroperoxide reductase OsmC/OhrA
MSEIGSFTIHLEHLEGYEYKVKFDWPQASEIIMDEPAPLGQQRGANASRLLAAALGNCLSASLLYCMSKHEPPEKASRTTVTCRMIRNDKGRMRVGGLEVKITLGGDLTQSERLKRCLHLFDDFCVVTASVRDGIPVQVQVVNEAGETLLQEKAD